MKNQIDYNQLAEDYARHRQVQPEAFKALLNDGKISPDTTLLEVGCGTGNYITALQGISGCAAWGIDPSEKMLAHAREQVNQVQYKIGQAENLDFADFSFDMIFSVDVIHHVKDRARYFQEAFRALKINGLICTVTDLEQVIRERSPLSVYFPTTVTEELKRYPKISQLREYMLSSGFSEIREYNVYFHYLLSDIQSYRDKAFSSLHLIDNQDFEKGIARMEFDLQKGPIQARSGYTLLWGENNNINEEYPIHRILEP